MAASLWYNFCCSLLLHIIPLQLQSGSHEQGTEHVAHTFAAAHGMCALRKLCLACFM